MYDRYLLGATLQELGDEYGMTREGVRQRFVRHGLPLLRRSERIAELDPPAASAPRRGLARTRHFAGRRAVARAYTNEDLLVALQEVARKIGRDTVSNVDYQRASDADPSLPSRTLYTQRFRSWNRALQLAGLKPGRVLRRHYNRMSDEDCIGAVLRVAEIVGWLPSTTEYERTRKEHPELNAPSMATLRNRFGNWLTVIERASVAGS